MVKGLLVQLIHESSLCLCAVDGERGRTDPL